MSSTVVYIEDNQSNRRLMERIAGKVGGVELHTADTGADGKVLALRIRPDLILLDLNLPDTDGIALITWIRSEPQLSSTPVYIVSADAMQGRRAQLLELGASGYITKPLDVAEVMDLLRRYGGEDAE